LRPLQIEPTVKTPKINFDPEKGVLLMSGRSMPENVLDLFEPILDWVEEYCKYPADTTTLIVKLEYFNTSSAKCILELLRFLEKARMSNNNILVKWFYETDDEDMLETGEDFSEIVRVPFELVPMPPD
jgi:hypothetical protein